MVSFNLNVIADKNLKFIVLITINVNQFFQLYEQIFYTVLCFILCFSVGWSKSRGGWWWFTLQVAVNYRLKVNSYF